MRESTPAAMNFHLFSPIFFEKWDWRSSLKRGIGGSETSHVEMAWRLARRGYKVTSYAPIPKDCPGKWRGTTWLPLEKADFTKPGVWVIYRDAACIDKIPNTPNHQIWLLCQDEVPRNLTPERIERCDKILAFCEWHKRHIERNFRVGDKVVVTSNGVKGDMIRATLSDPPERNIKRIVFTSSPDRGLLPLLKIFRRAKEFVDDLELHCFYGVNNIQKLVKWNKQFGYYKTFVNDLKRELKQPGVTWHGRVSQKQLYQEIAKSGLWVYPTNFTETSCISCMEAQALGAVPIFSPRAALAENVQHGVPIEGDANDPLTQARFVAEITKLCWYPQIQHDHRKNMMLWAASRFDWDRQVDQWEGWLHGWGGRLHVAQFAFQLKHAVPRVLNVGCADDPARLGEFGLNLDASKTITWSKLPTKAHVYHDFRKPLPGNVGKFKSVVLGDVLEHLSDKDAVAMLKNAKRVLEPKGVVVITCPEDHRPPENQHAIKTHKYLKGESAYHERPITRPIIQGWLDKAGLKAKVWQTIDYGLFVGLGVVAQGE